MMELDKKDRKLLYELDVNSRQTYSQLSKKVALSQEAVRYRVERLVKREIIQKFFTVINPAKLNFIFVKVLLRFHNIDESKKKEIINFLNDEDQVVWLVELDGSYDIGFVVKMSHIFELNYFLDLIYQKFHRYISKHDISTNIFGEYLTRDYLIGKDRKPTKEISYTAEIEPYKIDKRDRGILKELTKNARSSAVEIAKKLKISVDTVLQRLKRLEKDGVITRYNIVLNHEFFNQIHYKVLIFLSDFSPQKVNRFLALCRSDNRIVYIIKSLGRWNYELDIEVESLQQFREIMMQLTREFSGMIRDYDALIIRKIHKYNLYPK